jgi:hypothetical protein
MTRQLNLLSPSELRITPQTGCKEPRLWVRRLVLWSEPGVILREIKLRPGLNIVWSPDPGDQAQRARKHSMGHGSGKTLFCRLIRYCLGEDRFSPEEQRSSIALAFPKGAVGAEVIVDGTVWAILRPIGMNRQHYAIPDGDLDSIIAGKVTSTGIEPFLKAVESTILSADVATLVPVDRPFQAWLVALAWLARDQECRFDKVLDWRSPVSDSGSPARNLSGSKTLDALRALIGAITPEECRLREEITQLEAKQKDAGQEIGHSRWEAGKAQTRLISQLGLRRDEVPAGRLAVEVLRKTAKEGLAQVAEVKPATDVSDLDRLRSAGEEAKKRSDGLSEELAVIEGRIPVIERLLSEMRGELPGLSFSTKKAENPQCPICEVPIDHALAEGCKLSHKLPNSDEIRTRWSKLKEEIAQESDLLRQLIERQAFIKNNLPAARQHADELKNQVRSVEQAREARTDAWYKARHLIDEAGRLDDLLEALEKMQASADKLTEKIEAKRDRTGAFRDAQATVFHRLSYFFDSIIRHVAGPGAEGNTTLDGNGLKLSVKLGGERSTPAIDSLKVIVFDLAVLCMSMEGRTNIPAFLVHDSPREADLGLSIYHQIFYLMQELEKVGEQPLFQYIVTTTTRPPDELQKEPWLRDTLGGAPADARFLRRDL